VSGFVEVSLEMLVSALLWLEEKPLFDEYISSGEIDVYTIAPSTILYPLCGIGRRSFINIEIINPIL